MTCSCGTFCCPAGLVAAMNAAEEAGGSVAERVGARVAESCGLSFTPGTKVLLANGKAVPISTLKPSEKVVSTSTKMGTTRAGTIAAVLVHHDTNRYDLTLRAHGRTAVIHTASNHPFWTASNHPFWDHTGRWVKAGAHKYGTRLRTPAGCGTSPSPATTTSTSTPPPLLLWFTMPTAAVRQPSQLTTSSSRRGERKLRAERLSCSTHLRTHPKMRSLPSRG